MIQYKKILNNYGDHYPLMYKCIHKLHIHTQCKGQGPSGGEKLCQVPIKTFLAIDSLRSWIKFPYIYHILAFENTIFKCFLMCISGVQNAYIYIYTKSTDWQNYFSVFFDTQEMLSLWLWFFFLKMYMECTRTWNFITLF